MSVPNNDIGIIIECTELFELPGFIGRVYALGGEHDRTRTVAIPFLPPQTFLSGAGSAGRRSLSIVGGTSHALRVFRATSRSTRCILVTSHRLDRTDSLRQAIAVGVQQAHPSLALSPPVHPLPSCSRSSGWPYKGTDRSVSESRMRFSCRDREEVEIVQLQSQKSLKKSYKKKLSQFAFPCPANDSPWPSVQKSSLSN
ncbi:hypothetical protein BT96DRAFT_987006 [Gymnopus androsaceus JB14]|uniref:Uncharacterized protein n=1 Tax=Gymnopus androsaceus JB14 TaxID=1447944 RepID=A0A6A4IE74_9AGAR|nr:hypothetical protein BT96DRAFT_987006 [Gymnopus androsaceus JB14]